MDDENNISTILAQWQTCVESANNISERRDNTNNLFVTLNLAILATISFTWDVKMIALIISGITICVVWVFFINNFKHLNAAKFKVIGTLEEKLPVKAFEDEWNYIKLEKKYTEGTKLEKVLPILFIIVYVLIIIMLIVNKFSN